MYKSHKKRCRLINCPIGLFEYKGTLCLKTEYSLDECYTVDGGEIFWGDGTKTRETKGDFLVTPTSINEIEKRAVKKFAEKIKKKFDNKPIGINCIEVTEIWDAINDEIKKCNNAEFKEI